MKVVVRVADEETLVVLYEAARGSGLVAHVVQVRSSCLSTSLLDLCGG